MSGRRLGTGADGRGAGGPICDGPCLGTSESVAESGRGGDRSDVTGGVGRRGRTDRPGETRVRDPRDPFLLRIVSAVIDGVGCKSVVNSPTH